MTRDRLGRIGAAVAAAVLVVAGAAASAQDWRSRALASFDDAWQTIHDTFYDPTFGGLDWAAVRTELRPRVEAAQTPEDARGAIRDMLSRLRRSHFALLSATSDDALPGRASVPVDVRMLDGEAVIVAVTSAAARAAGLAPGQTLQRIAAQSVADLVRAAEGPDARTRAFDGWRRVFRELHGSEGSRVALGVGTVDGRSREITVGREIAHGEVVTLGNMPPLTVAVNAREQRTPAGRRAGVIWFSVWMTAINEPFERALDAYRRHDGIVLDLRGNPGGLAGLMRRVSGHFIPDAAVLGTMRTRNTELTFTVNPQLVSWDGRKVAPFAGPLAILVDELTGSASETFAGALQSLGRARIFGRTTMGQALPALTRQLPNGDVLMHAVGDFVTSTGRSLEGPGVIPDVEVPLSRKALAAGQDQALQAALRWIDESAARRR